MHCYIPKVEISQSSLETFSIQFPLSLLLSYLGHPIERSALVSPFPVCWSFSFHLSQFWAGLPLSLAWSIALADAPASSFLCLLIRHSYTARMTFLRFRAAHGIPCLSLFDYFFLPLEKVWTIYPDVIKLFPVGLRPSFLVLGPTSVYQIMILSLPKISMLFHVANIWEIFFSLESLFTFSPCQTPSNPSRLRFCWLNWISCKWSLKRCWDWHTSPEYLALV